MGEEQSLLPFFRLSSPGNVTGVTDDDIISQFQTKFGIEDRNAAIEQIEARSLAKVSETSQLPYLRAATPGAAAMGDSQLLSEFRRSNPDYASVSNEDLIPQLEQRSNQFLANRYRQAIAAESGPDAGTSALRGVTDFVSGSVAGNPELDAARAAHDAGEDVNLPGTAVGRFQRNVKAGARDTLASMVEGLPVIGSMLTEAVRMMPGRISRTARSMVATGEDQEAIDAEAEAARDASRERFGKVLEAMHNDEYATDKVANFLESKLSPEERVGWAADLGSAFGSAGAFMAMTLMSAGAGGAAAGAGKAGATAAGKTAAKAAAKRTAAGRAAKASTLTFGAASGASGDVNEALDSGASGEDAILSAQLGALGGALEILPAEMLAARVVGKVPGASLFSRLGSAKSQKGIQAAISSLPRKHRIALGMGLGGAEEGAQETIQGFLSNLAANKTWDPDRDLDEGLAKAALIGAITGGVLGGGSSAFGSRKGKSDTDAARDIATADVVDAQEKAARSRAGRAKKEAAAAARAGAPAAVSGVSLAQPISPADAQAVADQEFRYRTDEQDEADHLSEGEGRQAKAATVFANLFSQEGFDAHLSKEIERTDDGKQQKISIPIGDNDPAAMQHALLKVIESRTKTGAAVPWTSSVQGDSVVFAPDLGANKDAAPAAAPAAEPAPAKKPAAKKPAAKKKADKAATVVSEAATVTDKAAPAKAEAAPAADAKLDAIEEHASAEVAAKEAAIAKAKKAAPVKAKPKTKQEKKAEARAAEVEAIEAPEVDDDIAESVSFDSIEDEDADVKADAEPDQELNTPPPKKTKAKAKKAAPAVKEEVATEEETDAKLSAIEEHANAETAAKKAAIAKAKKAEKVKETKPEAGAKVTMSRRGIEQKVTLVSQRKDGKWNAKTKDGKIKVVKDTEIRRAAAGPKGVTREAPEVLKMTPQGTLVLVPADPVAPVAAGEQAELFPAGVADKATIEAEIAEQEAAAPVETEAASSPEEEARRQAQADIQDETGRRESERLFPNTKREGPPVSRKPALDPSKAPKRVPIEVSEDGELLAGIDDSDQVAQSTPFEFTPQQEVDADTDAAQQEAVEAWEAAAEEVEQSVFEKAQNEGPGKNPWRSTPDSQHVKALGSASRMASRFLNALADMVGLPGKILVVRRTDIGVDGLTDELQSEWADAARAIREDPRAPVFAVQMTANGNFVMSIPDGFATFRNIPQFLRNVENLSHEFGHAVKLSMLANADKETRDAIFEAYGKFKSKVDGDTRKKSGERYSAAEIIAMLKPHYNAAVLLGGKTDLSAVSPDAVPQMQEYLTTFPEWFSDNVAKWVLSTSTPRTLVGRFFKKVAQAMESIYTWGEKNHGPMYPAADRSIQEWLDREVRIREAGMHNIPVKDKRGRVPNVGSPLTETQRKRAVKMRDALFGLLKKGTVAPGRRNYEREAWAMEALANGHLKLGQEGIRMVENAREILRLGLHPITGSELTKEELRGEKGRQPVTVEKIVNMMLEQPMLAAAAVAREGSRLTDPQRGAGTVGKHRRRKKTDPVAAEGPRYNKTQDGYEVHWDNGEVTFLSEAAIVAGQLSYMRGDKIVNPRLYPNREMAEKPAAASVDKQLDPKNFNRVVSKVKKLLTNAADIVMDESATTEARMEALRTFREHHQALAELKSAAEFWAPLDATFRASKKIANSRKFKAARKQLGQEDKYSERLTRAGIAKAGQDMAKMGITPRVVGTMRSPDEAKSVSDVRKLISKLKAAKSKEERSLTIKEIKEVRDLAAQRKDWRAVALIELELSANNVQAAISAERLRAAMDGVASPEKRKAARKAAAGRFKWLLERRTIFAKNAKARAERRAKIEEAAAKAAAEKVGATSGAEYDVAFAQALEEEKANTPPIQDGWSLAREGVTNRHDFVGVVADWIDSRRVSQTGSTAAGKGAKTRDGKDTLRSRSMRERIKVLLRANYGSKMLFSAMHRNGYEDVAESTARGERVLFTAEGTDPRTIFWVRDKMMDFIAGDTDQITQEQLEAMEEAFGDLMAAERVLELDNRALDAYHEEELDAAIKEAGERLAQAKERAADGRTKPEAYERAKEQHELEVEEINSRRIDKEMRRQLNRMEKIRQETDEYNDSREPGTPARPYLTPSAEIQEAMDLLEDSRERLRSRRDSLRARSEELGRPVDEVVAGLSGIIDQVRAINDGKGKAEAKKAAISAVLSDAGYDAKSPEGKLIKRLGKKGGVSAATESAAKGQFQNSRQSQLRDVKSRLKKLGNDSGPMSYEEALGKIEEAKKDEAQYRMLRETGRRFREFALDQLRYGVSGGIISQKEFDDMRADNLFWVSFMRNQHQLKEKLREWSGTGDLGQIGDPVKGIKNSNNEADLINPFHALAMTGQILTNEVTKNQLINELIESARPVYKDADPDSFVGRTLRNKTERVLQYVPGFGYQVAGVSADKKTETLLSPEWISEKEFFERLDKTAAEKTEDAVYAKIARPAGKGEVGDVNQVERRVNGQSEPWIMDPDLGRILNGLDMLGNGSQDMSHPVLRMMTSFARSIRWTLRKMPDFMVRNGIRDPFARMILSRHGVEGKKFMRSYLQRVRGDDSVSVARERAGGGFYGYHAADEADYYQFAHENAMRWTKESGGRIQFVPQKKMGAWLKNWETLLARPEYATRDAEFQIARDNYREAGMSEYDADRLAALDAAELLDFQRMGTFLSVINQVVPFSNAAIQGLSIGYRRMSSAERGFTAGARAKAAVEQGSAFRKMMLMTSVPSALAMGWAHLNDDEEEYWQLDPLMRDLNWMFKMPGTDNWIAIPKPFELGMASSMIERGAQGALFGDGHEWDKLAPSLAKSFIPLDPSAMALGFKPLLEMSMNKTFFNNRQIIPASEEGLRVDDRVGADDASSIAHFLSNLSRPLPGERFDPRYFDHLITGYMGGGGRLVTQGSNLLTGAGGQSRTETAEDIFKRVLGVVKEDSPWMNRDVGWVFEASKKYGLTSKAEYRRFSELIKYYNQMAPDEAEAIEDTISSMASAIRMAWEAQTGGFEAMQEAEAMKKRIVRDAMRDS